MQLDGGGQLPARPEKEVQGLLLEVSFDILPLCFHVAFYYLLISTAESVQLCYTNQYGVLVIVGIVVIVSMVNFFSFDVSIQFLPLIRIIWMKECLITTDSYWGLQFRCWWWKKQIIL